jgi:hypothetical protein
MDCYLGGLALIKKQLLVLVEKIKNARVNKLTKAGYFFIKMRRKSFDVIMMF